MQTSPDEDRSPMEVVTPTEAALGPSAVARGTNGKAAGPALNPIDEIRRLAAQGLRPWEIAQRTHRGREEVRLLLELKEQRNP